MKNFLILMFMLFMASIFSGCGKQDYNVNVDDSKHTVTGEAYQYVIVRFEFIESIKQLCNDLYIYTDYDSLDKYKQDIAKCTFDNLSILDIGLVDEFTNEFCEDKPSDYDDLTPEEKAQVDQLCEVL